MDLTKTGFVDGNGKPLHKWQVRIRSQEPTLIEFSETHFGDFNVARLECYKVARRTSYMVEGPNREVWWAIDWWNPEKRSWECIVDGKSKLHEGAAPS